MGDPSGDKPRSSADSAASAKLLGMQIGNLDTDLADLRSARANDDATQRELLDTLKERVCGLGDRLASIEKLESEWSERAEKEWGDAWRELSTTGGEGGVGVAVDRDATLGLGGEDPSL